jgi:hypothetical protein
MLCLSFDPVAKDHLALQTEDGRIVVIQVRPHHGRRVTLSIDADRGVTVLRGRVWDNWHPDEPMAARPPRCRSV